MATRDDVNVPEHAGGWRGHYYSMPELELFVAHKVTLIL